MYRTAVRQLGPAALRRPTLLNNGHTAIALQRRCFRVAPQTGVKNDEKVHVTSAAVAPTPPSPMGPPNVLKETKVAGPGGDPKAKKPTRRWMWTLIVIGVPIALYTLYDKMTATRSREPVHAVADQRAEVVEPSRRGLLVKGETELTAEAELAKEPRTLLQTVLDWLFWRPALLGMRVFRFTFNSYLLGANALHAVLRAVELAILFSPLVLTFPVYWWRNAPTTPVDLRNPDELDITKAPRGKRSLWDWYLLWVLEKSGPTFIKLGQWASTRPDLFPIHLCRTLGKLQSRVDPHAYMITEATLEEAFGIDVQDLFPDIGHSPVGSGCMAQVRYLS